MGDAGSPWIWSSSVSESFKHQRQHGQRRRDVRLELAFASNKGKLCMEVEANVQALWLHRKDNLYPMAYFSISHAPVSNLQSARAQTR